MCHERSYLQQLRGYSIGAKDGEIGHVEDFLVHEENWAIQYMVVDTRNWLPGRKVLVAPRWIDNVTWLERKVTINKSREEIKNAPPYDPAAAVKRT